MIGEHIPGEGLPLIRVGDIELYRGRIASHGQNQVHRFIGGIQIEVGNYHVGTAFGEPHGRGPTDTAAGTGHHHQAGLRRIDSHTLSPAVDATVSGTTEAVE
ncbi:Uncharacterised protein [Mycobacteroides abscessus subsp. abscessus]|nr:Uncharacterised protein [Mycobacteroides abscessus subsp. abscessus]SKV65377.1 Uncharacterised protein [Mycobacteroides abscessus subsp. abscessus]